MVLLVIDDTELARGDTVDGSVGTDDERAVASILDGSRQVFRCMANLECDPQRTRRERGRKRKRLGQEMKVTNTEFLATTL